MMIDPGNYIEQFKDASYLELMEERDSLIAFMHKYEQDEIAGDRTDPSWGIHPQPVVRYQMYLEYLAALCKLMRDKYNHEYVWGDRTLNQDSEQSSFQHGE